MVSVASEIALDQLVAIAALPIDTSSGGKIASELRFGVADIFGRTVAAHAQTGIRDELVLVTSVVAFVKIGAVYASPIFADTATVIDSKEPLVFTFVGRGIVAIDVLARSEVEVIVPDIQDRSEVGRHVIQ